MLNKKRKSSRLSETKESPDSKRGSPRVSSRSPSPRRVADTATGEWERRVERIDTVEKRNRRLYASVLW